MRLPIVEVISGGTVSEAAYEGEGEMVRSGRFDGTPTAGGVAKQKVTAWLEEAGLGKREITYKLRDWTFARQRYWGEPIPVLKDGDRVVRALELDELPLVLPIVESYKPLGTGASPLAAAKSWVEVVDGKSGQPLSRETDTMPGSAGSSWYFLRYCDPKNDRELCARDKSDYWMPVDLYVGGAEHTVGHLLYARMWQRFLAEMGLVRDREPFHKLRHQGMVLGAAYYDADKRVVPEADVEERDGKYYRRGTDQVLSMHVEKMSKRLGNVVNPDDVMNRYGADAMRVYICFMGPLESDKPWQTNGLEGQFAWLKRTWRLFFEGDEDAPRASDSEPTPEELRVIHKAVKKVGEDIESLNLNTAISALHVASRDLTQLGARSKSVLGPLAQIIAPFAPHFAEELWEKGLGRTGGITYAPWPSWEERWVKDETIAMGVQVMGKTRGEIMIAPDADEETAVALAKACPPVAKMLEGKKLVRVVYKAGRILNLIIQ
jgi:leucyl-tRNA synthetase